MSGEDLIARRRRLLGRHVTTFYEEPFAPVRGEGVWLYDREGRPYLDCYNNVPHVGHCHPRVVEAIARQTATLNVHTRYVHDLILDYGERLTARLGGGLSAMIMVCTGSEANDVALRMAEAVTGNRGFIGTDNTYHGNTAAVSQLNARKVPVGGFGDHVRKVPAPDNLAPVGGSQARQSEAFCAEVERKITELQASPHGFAGLILCPYFANEGFPTLSRGFLDRTVEAVRRAGGLVIADEVQPGFGRLGSHFWGHERLGFTPDIVTMGKPMANGYPAAAVVTRPEILEAFQEQFRYFNTFGGNPVAAAAALATLQVIEDEGLQANARDVGDHLLARLREIGARHEVVADVRGAGMFQGLELMDGDRPATASCARLVNEMRRRGVLLHSAGRYDHILKIRPPLVFARENADLLADTLDKAFQAVSERP